MATLSSSGIVYADETPSEFAPCPYCGGVLNACHDCMNHCDGAHEGIYEKPEMI